MHTDYFQNAYGMHWTEASNLLLEYYNKYQTETPTWDAREERIDRSTDNSVTTIEVDASEGDA